MEIQKDFKELLVLFNTNHVEYMVVGAYALAFHGVPRYTGDLDLLVHADHANAARVMLSLRAFGFESVGLTENDFVERDRVVQLGVPPVRIDLLTSLSGVTWEEAVEGRTSGAYGDVPVFFIGRDQLIANKRATGRTRDRADLEALGE